MQYSHKILEKIGLSKGEIQVYLAGLKLGPALASALSKEAKLSRPLVYYILESLEAKGLVSKFGHKHGGRFTTESPSRLKGILERKRKELEKIERQLAEANATVTANEDNDLIIGNKGSQNYENCLTTSGNGSIMYM